MSIDDYAGGAGCGAASLLHRNRDEEFPGWAGCDLAGAGLTAQILARDGATAADVLERQLPHAEQPAAVITLTMGGNDLLAAYGDDAAARAAITAVIAAGEDILARLAEAGTGTRIIISSVYDPSDGTGRADPGGLLPPWPAGPALVRDLNTGLGRLAGRHGAVIADVHRQFLGHGITAGDPSQPLPRPASRDLWYCGAVEPNAWGAHQIRRTWWHALHADRLATPSRHAALASIRVWLENRSRYCARTRRSADPRCHLPAAAMTAEPSHYGRLALRAPANRDQAPAAGTEHEIPHRPGQASFGTDDQCRFGDPFSVEMTDCLHSVIEADWR